MNLLSLFAVMVMTTHLGLGLSTLKHDPRSGLNRSFFAVCAGAALWALGYAFIYSGPEPNTMFWYRLGAVGWCLVPGSLLIFMVHLAENRLKNKPLLIVAIAYLPGLVVLIPTLIGTTLTLEFKAGPFGCYETQDTLNPFYLIYLVYNITYLISGVSLVRYQARKSRSKKKIRESRLITASFVFAVIFALGTNAVLPFFIERIPSLGALGTIVPGVLMWYVINRYKLMTLAPLVAAPEILGRMNDLVFLLDDQDRIIEANSKAEKLFTLTKNLPAFSSLLTEKSLFEQTREEMLSNQAQSFSLRTSLYLGPGKLLPVNIDYASLHDKNGDGAGSVVVAHDMRNTLQLEREVMQRKALMQQLEQERNQLRIRNQIIETELALARSIQMRLIPDRPTLEEIATWYRPMDIIGGDFFDFINFGTSRTVGIFVSDVSGHGVPAAFITSMIKSAILQTANRLPEPSSFLHYLNDFLLTQTNGNFVTAFYGIYDRITRYLRYANAGHPEPYLLAPDMGKVYQIPSAGRGLPLAVFSNHELGLQKKIWHDQSLILPENSRLLMYTDGLNEASAASDPETLFGDQLLEETLSRHADKPPLGILKALTRELISFHGSDSFSDDICLICLATE